MLSSDGACMRPTCHLPGLERLDGYCRDCYWLVFIGPRLEERHSLFHALSQCETEIARHAAKLEGPPPSDVYANIVHACVCGFTTRVYMQLVAHIDGAPAGEQHGLLDREAKQAILSRASAAPKARQSGVLAPGQKINLGNIR